MTGFSPTSSGKGGSAGGGATVLSTTTLGADTATIDTGAAGFSTAFSILVIDALLRDDDAAAVSFFTLILNNDAGANYDSQRLEGSAAAASASTTLAANSWTLRCHGAGGTANYASATRVIIPGYGGTTFAKVAHALCALPDGIAGNNAADCHALGYRSTSAISRVKVTVAGAGTVLKTGSMLVVSAF